jgi:hypothetical protein
MSHPDESLYLRTRIHDMKPVIADFLKGNTISFRFISKTTLEKNSKNENVEQTVSTKIRSQVYFKHT